MRLIIADDDDVYRSGMVRAADQHPDIDLVAEADGGAAALTAIAQHRPDIALVDLRMPAVDGIDVCRRAAGLVPSRSVQVVILSVHTEAEAQTRALEAGAVAFLTKDLPRKDIMRRLVEIAARRAAERGLVAD